jgi:hypothetical protein
MTDQQMANPTGCIQIGPLGWADTWPALQALLCDGNEIGREYAKREMKRMAEAADLATEVLDGVLAFLDTLGDDQKLTLPPLLRALLNRDRLPDTACTGQESRADMAIEERDAASAVPLRRARVGQLAKAAGHRLPLEVLYSAAGFYIGTCLEGMPYSRESAEYFRRREAAENALANDTWTQRETD